MFVPFLLRGFVPGRTIYCIRCGDSVVPVCFPTRRATPSGYQCLHCGVAFGPRIVGFSDGWRMASQEFTRRFGWLPWGVR